MQLLYAIKDDRKPLSAEAIAALRSYDKPRLVWSDAWRGGRSDDPAARGGLGFVVFDPFPSGDLSTGVNGYMPTHYLQPAC
eukprot:6209293-Pleurochrysis_carterae.AAC.1